jgi:hypothetical protein
MAGKLSIVVVNEILDHVLKTGAFAQPDHLQFSLWNGDPEGAGVECSGATYARVQCDDWNAAVPATRSIKNTSQADFPEAGADWGNINYIGIHGVITEPESTYLVGKLAIEEIAVTLGMNLYIEAEIIEVAWLTGGVCNTWAALMLDHIFMNTPLEQPTNLYLGLSIANPGNDVAGIDEPIGNNYSRSIHNTWNIASAKATSNNGILDSPVASGPWGVISHSFISDHLDSVLIANIIFYGALETPLTIGDGDKLRYPDTDLDIVVDAT